MSWIKEVDPRRRTGLASATEAEAPRDPSRQLTPPRYGYPANGASAFGAKASASRLKAEKAVAQVPPAKVEPVTSSWLWDEFELPDEG